MTPLLSHVYEELKQLARRFMSGERSDHTLDPTALVHEAYLKIVDLDSIEWQDRAHFYVVAATAMRRILVQHGRSHGRQKRGGGWRRRPLDAESKVSDSADPSDIVALDDALTKLAKTSERRARVVELRYFAGLEHEEVARVLSVSLSTVKQDWHLAKAWLLREMSGAQ